MWTNYKEYVPVSNSFTQHSFQRKEHNVSETVRELVIENIDNNINFQSDDKIYTVLAI